MTAYGCAIQCTTFLKMHNPMHAHLAEILERQQVARLLAAVTVEKRRSTRWLLQPTATEGKGTKGAVDVSCGEQNRQTFEFNTPQRKCSFGVYWNGVANKASPQATIMDRWIDRHLSSTHHNANALSQCIGTELQTKQVHKQQKMDRGRLH